MNRLISISIFAIGMVFLPFISRAQNTDLLSANDVSVEVSPEIPGPDQDVTITLTSYSLNLDKLYINWSVDGKGQNSGVGVKKLTFHTGAVGQTSTVEIYVIINNASRIDKKIVIQPSEIDMLWEATDSYVPPFYEGKALASSEANIKVVAIPNVKIANGTRPAASTFVYNWKRNYTANQGVSGYGKNSFPFKASYLNKEEKISVQASTASGISYGASGSLTITTSNPKIIFYEDTPSTGVNYAHALNDGFTLRDPEVSIVAEPYFFSPNNPTSSDLSYKWKINNNAIDTPATKNILVVRGGSSGGRAKVELAIESVSKLFQLANQYFFVELNK
jgi:hypothetical protein